MSRKVPNDAPLSEEDRQYLHARGEHARVEMLDARYPETGDDAEEADAEPDAEPDPDPDPADDYDEWTKEELQAELVKRKLAKSGTNSELIARLRADDAAE